MKQIRKILHIKLNDEKASIRTIAGATQISRPVVKNYLDLLERHPLTQEMLNTLNDETLKIHLGIEGPPIQDTEENIVLKRWLEKYIYELTKVGVTRRLLHERYLEEYLDGLQYSQFCFVIKQLFQNPESSSLLEHKAGDKMYIDFTGNKLHWKDTTDKEYTEEIFLSVMGASSMLFTIPLPSQKMTDFAYATEQAFLFYGGVPKAVVPDCLKSAVLKHDGYESVINPLFQHLMDHYDSVCLPARPLRPKDKPLVEGAVNLVYRQILARMHYLKFENRSAMLDWWQKAVKKINDAPFQKLPGSRQTRFDETDKIALKPLPSSSFELTSVLNQKVQTTGVVYISDDKTSYSVPSSLQGKKVEVLVSPASLEIWYEGERKALHERQPGAGKVICPAHRPKSLQWYADRNLDELQRALALSGVHVAVWTRQIIDSAPHEDQAWMILQGLKKLVTKYFDRIDTVCRVAHKREEYTLNALKRILQNEEDLILRESERLTPELPLHENVRGSDYYKLSVVNA
jgi:transposase